MRRTGWVVYLLVVLALLPGHSGCSWVGARRSGREVPTPEATAQARRLSEQAQEAVDAGDLATAEAALAQMVTLSPRSPEGYHRLGSVLSLLGRSDEAQSRFQKALELDADHVGALIGLAKLEAAIGQLDTALNRLETAIEIEPNAAQGHLALAHLLEASGRTDDALAAYFRALEADPFLSEANVRIAAVQLARNEPHQALVRLDQTLEATPGEFEAVFLRGRAHLALRRFPQAVADLRSAAQSFPERPDVHLALAEALEASHRPDDALIAVEAVLRLAPGDAAARSLAERLRR